MLEDSAQTFMTVSQVFSTGVTVLGNTALLIVALTVVRRADGRAAALMAASFGVELGLAILSPVAYAVVAALVGVDYLGLSYTAIGVLVTLIRLGAIALLAFGIVCLVRTLSEKPESAQAT